MIDLQSLLHIPAGRLDEINKLIEADAAGIIRKLVDVVNRYGTVEEINRKAREHSKLDYQMARLKEFGSPHVVDLEWLIKERDAGAFISIPDYRRKVLGDKADSMKFADDTAVTLEISALQYFPWIIEEAKQAIDRKELMPGRFIRVRNMKEQEADHDILAVSAAMNIVGASRVETLDNKGTDGSNIHLGGPATITGYFGGVGQPNDHPYLWADELLHFYTEYGVNQVLNINAGTILTGFLLRRMGIDIEFKISVYMGIDNPFSMLWTLMMARLFATDDGQTPLIGFNLSNSVNNETIEQGAVLRKALGFEDRVRFEHHIFETYKSIVIQPYDRRAELLELAEKVPNISAKHEGGEIEVEQKREHPSDILEYFLPRADIESSGLMPALLRNYLDKHDSVNNTARALTEKGLSVVAAWNLHKGVPGK